MYKQLALWFFHVDPKSITFQVVSGLNMEFQLVFARLSIFLKSGGVTWTIQMKPFQHNF